MNPFFEQKEIKECQSTEFKCTYDQLLYLIQLVNQNTELQNALKTCDTNEFENSKKDNQVATSIYNSFVHYIESKCKPSSSSPKAPLLDIPSSDLVKQEKKKTKIYVDGVFDMAHFGHLNALRQAWELGDELYVGVISDEAVLGAKGVYPIYTSEERARIIKACKWVTGIFTEVDYDVTLKFFLTTGCDYVAHGDDLAVNGDGTECYGDVRRAGFLKVFKRTSGISSTTVISRLLGVTTAMPVVLPDQKSPPLRTSSLTKTSAQDVLAHVDKEQSIDKSVELEEFADDNETSEQRHEFKQLKNHMLLSAKRVMQFMGTPKHPKPSDRVIYVDGSFDILHCGHISLLEQAAALGDFLIVGIFDDATARSMEGPLHPFQNMFERALNVMALRCVDDVLIGAPSEIFNHMLTAFNIYKVVRGQRPDTVYELTPQDRKLQKINKLEIVTLDTDFTYQTIVDRILANRKKLQKALITRQIREDTYNDQDIKSHF